MRRAELSRDSYHLVGFGLCDLCYKVTVHTGSTTNCYPMRLGEGREIKAELRVGGIEIKIVSLNELSCGPRLGEC